MGYKHRRSDLLDAAVEAVVDEGLGQLSFGRLAARLGIADRTVVYYFPTKEQLVTEVLAVLGAQLMTVLDDAFGREPLPPDELLRRAWPALTTDAADRVFRVFFECVGLSVAGIAPYADLTPALLDAWAAWLEPRVAAGDDARARTLALMAKLDGLLLLRHISGAEPAEAAARSLGVA